MPSVPPSRGDDAALRALGSYEWSIPLCVRVLTVSLRKAWSVVFSWPLVARGREFGELVEDVLLVFLPKCNDDATTM